MSMTLNAASFISAMQFLSDSVDEAAMDAIEEAAEAIFTESQDEVPWDTGELARSGKVKRHKDYVTISYKKEYAAKQHEEPPWSYSHPGGRKWKYLEDPLKRNADGVFKEVAKGVRLGLGG